MYAVSSDTFVSVCVSKQPIVWDEEDNQVNLIMLMHIGKNNTQAFQLWDYISKIFADKTLVEKLVEAHRMIIHCADERSIGKWIKSIKRKYSKKEALSAAIRIEPLFGVKDYISEIS